MTTETFTPAKRGDLIVIRQESTDYVQGEGSKTTVEVNVFAVAGITRDGRVRTVRRLDFGGTGTPQPLERMIRVTGYWLVPRAGLDLYRAVQAVRAHRWPGHADSDHIMPWYGEEGLREVRELLRSCLAAGATPGPTPA